MTPYDTPHEPTWDHPSATPSWPELPIDVVTILRSYSSVDYFSCGIVVDVFCWLLVFASVAVVQTMCDSFYPAAVPHDQTYSRLNVVISTFADLLFNPPGGDCVHLSVQMLTTHASSVGHVWTLLS